MLCSAVCRHIGKVTVQHLLNTDKNQCVIIVVAKKMPKKIK